jgi:hypothetical protein
MMKRAVSAVALIFIGYFGYTSYNAVNDRKQKAAAEAKVFQTGSKNLQNFITKNRLNWDWYKEVGDGIFQNGESMNSDFIFRSMSRNKLILIHGQIEDYIKTEDGNYLISIKFSPLEENELDNFRIKARCSQDVMKKLIQQRPSLISNYESGDLVFFAFAINSLDEINWNKSRSGEAVLVAYGNVFDAFVWNSDRRKGSISVMAGVSSEQAGK